MPRVSKKTDKPHGGKVGKPKPADQWDCFFEELSKFGNTSRAAEVAGIPRPTIYNRLQTDDAFAKRYEEAKAHGLEGVEDEALRRATKGVETPVFYMGEKVATVTTFSDALIQFLLKGGKPQKYRDRISTENVNLNSDSPALSRRFGKLSDAEIEAEMKKRMS